MVKHIDSIVDLWQSLHFLKRFPSHVFAVMLNIVSGCAIFLVEGIESAYVLSCSGVQLLLMSLIYQSLFISLGQVIHILGTARTPFVFSFSPPHLSHCS